MMERIRLELPEANIILREKCYRITRLIYGDSISESIDNRLNKELEAIEKNDSATIYVIASDLVKVSKERGYCVTARGPVGSSLVAYLCGLTDVNPMQAHYVCSNCYHFEKVDIHWNELWNPAVDLERKDCPICGQIMYPDGADILSEVGMGEKLDNISSITLNFAPCIRPDIIGYIKERFKEDWIFRAGTIGDNGKSVTTMGVHPGRIYIVPGCVNLEQYTFLRDCNDEEFSLPVSVKDYHELEDYFLKYDILVRHELELLHDLEEATGFRHEYVELSGPEIADVFYTDIYEDVVLYPCSKELVHKVQPRIFSDFVRLISFTHAVRVNNTMLDNILKQERSLKEVICCRDDVIQCLINKGFDHKSAYCIMNYVRKGKRLTDEMVSSMSGAGVPNWCIEDCNHIRYLYPRSQMMAYMKVYWIIAAYLLYHPQKYKRVFYRWVKKYGNEVCMINSIQRSLIRLEELSEGAKKTAGI